MSWKPIYGLLIFGLTLVNFLMGWLISKSMAKRKLFLIAAIAINLITLAFFKYTYFFRDLTASIGSHVGAHVPAIEWKIILPLGISFFVFEFIHYVVDVYRGSKPIKSFWDFALFASFFPTQIAGPIKRYQDFMAQIGEQAKTKLTLEMIHQSVYWIILGLIKKILFADNLGVVVHSAFEHPELLSSLDLWLAVYAFAFQIYFDFSGYTDVARGSALLLAFKVPPNFNLPYLSNSISEFWKRWHISLSTWLRDYLYIPLGGSRGNRFSTSFNLMLTMILGGIWHGAAMHFVIWGFYQGFLLVAHKEFKIWTDKIAWFYSLKQRKLFYIFSVLLTFHAVCLGWVFFRADSFSQAVVIIKRLLFITALSNPQTCLTVNPLALTIVNTKESVAFLLLPIILGILVLGQVLSASKLPEMPLLKNRWIAATALAISVCLLVIYSPDYAPQFIYFQF